MGLPVLEKAFNEAIKIPSSDGGSASSRQHMGYEQFDKFLSSAQTTQVKKVNVQPRKTRKRSFVGYSSLFFFCVVCSMTR